MGVKQAVNALIRKYEALPDTISKAYMALVITTVDEFAQQFKNGVEQATPVRMGDLENSIKLVQTYNRKRGTYGYKIRFEGYKKGARKKTGNPWEEPFQVIANTINKGKRETDRGTVIIKTQAVGFINKQLAILREINPKLANNIMVGGWSIDDAGVMLNDGTYFSRHQLDSFKAMLNATKE